MLKLNKKDRGDIMDHKVITLSREFGSGGRDIGKKIADELGYDFYDKELIEAAAQRSGIDPEILEQNDEKLNTRFSPSFNSMNSIIFSTSQLSLNDRTFLAEAEIIKEIANNKNAVIVGRCANYILEDYKNCYNVFIHANLEDRMERAHKAYGLPEKKLKEAILTADKKRSSYYNYYSDKQWGKAQNYHVCLDSSCLGIDKCVEILLTMVK